MVAMTQEILREELRRHAAPGDEVTPAVLEQMKAQGTWEGRRWEVLQIVAEDSERMAYLAGGVRPDEVATWVGFWSDSDLELEQIRLVISAGGYDPDPFRVLARLGTLSQVLVGDTGEVRRIEGELAGAWISDRFAGATDDEVETWARSL
jgi:hypothetical protein